MSQPYTTHSLTPLAGASTFHAMSIAASTPNELSALIQPHKLHAAGFSAPSRVSVIAGTDHTGEEAYHVYLVYPDDTPDEQLSWSVVKPMVQWVRDQIRKADGEQRWPYVRVAREADLLAILN